MVTTDKKLTLRYLLPAVLLAGLIFISGDSLWIDEGNTAYKAMQLSVSSWWQALVSEGGSDAQMPLYMLFIWLWEKVAGSTELALRLSNLFWLGIAAVSLRHFRYGTLCILCSAFVLYYANELRPYMMQIAATALAISGLRQLDQTNGWRQTLFACFLLCGSSLTGVLWAAGILVGVLVDDVSRLRAKWFWKGILISAPCFLLLGAYYFSSLLLGQQAASMGGGVITSMGAVVYELLGLLGVGPSRVELRENPKSVIPYLIVIVPMAVTMTLAVGIGAYSYFKTFSWQRRFAILCAIGLPSAAFLILLLFKDFRVLGRHLAPASVVLVLCIARVLSHQGQRSIHLRAFKAIAWCSLVFSLASALNHRFNERHARDDYKGAALIAHRQMDHKKQVVWAADKRTSEYYGITGNLEFCTIWQHGKDDIPELQGDETVIISKKDIYDPGEIFTNHLKAVGFRPVNQLQAFTIWQTP